MVPSSNPRGGVLGWRCTGRGVALCTCTWYPHITSARWRSLKCRVRRGSEPLLTFSWHHDNNLIRGHGEHYR